MIKNFVSLIVVAAMLNLSCDPVRRIDIKNSTADSAQFIWTLNEDSLMNNPFLISNSKELKFTLYPPKNEIKMSFGSGSWTPKEVQKLMGYLTSFEIISPSQRIKIDSLPLLKEFLLARRKGVGGARIEIVVSQ